MWRTDSVFTGIRPHLDDVYLGHNDNLTDAGMEILAANHAIKEVAVGNTSVTVRGYHDSMYIADI